VKSVFLILLMGLFSPLALAHTIPYGSTGFETGLLHPLLGIDHLAMLLGVGVLASGLGGAARLRLPLVFFVLMVAGAVQGVQWSFAEQGFLSWLAPSTEVMIVLSVVVVGMLLCSGVSFSERVGLALVVAFGWAHGLAHGFEAPLGGEVFGFFLGMMISSTLLLTAGVGVMQWCVRSNLNAMHVQAIRKVMGLGMLASLGYTLLGALS
jgi:urease accessory protein